MEKTPVFNTGGEKPNNLSPDCGKNPCTIFSGGKALFYFQEMGYNGSLKHCFKIKEKI